MHAAMHKPNRTWPPPAQHRLQAKPDEDRKWRSAAVQCMELMADAGGCACLRQTRASWPCTMPLHQTLAPNPCVMPCIKPMPVLYACCHTRRAPMRSAESRPGQALLTYTGLKPHVYENMRRGYSNIVMKTCDPLKEFPEKFCIHSTNRWAGACLRAMQQCFAPHNEC